MHVCVCKAMYLRQLAKYNVYVYIKSCPCRKWLHVHVYMNHYSCNVPVPQSLTCGKGLVSLNFT